ncbi:MAG: ATP synthase F1 subunit delta [Flavobacteriales bacterium]|jgi:F-type H+-transporting ATPase subunit delta|nr:ATP synthase F1 subunit delta [Flavobacteriales bacterium]
MQNQRIGSRYADALLSLAQKQNCDEKVLEDMQAILSTLQENKELDDVLKSPIIPSDKKQAILNQIFAQESHETTVSMIKLLSENKREDILRALATSYIELYKESKNMVTATVTTAFPLDEATRSQITKLVNSQVDGTVALEEKVDEDIIGGYILQIGDQRINNSLANQLSSLKREFELKTLS